MCMRVLACSLIYPTCNAYAPYCNVFCGPSGSTTFSAISHRQYDYRKKVTEYKMCFLFSLQLLFETFLILKRNQQDTAVNMKTSLCKITVIFVGS